MSIKNNLILFMIMIALSFLTGCSSDDDVDVLIGTWELQAVSISDTDSEMLEEVASDKFITFREDRTFVSNGEMCVLSSSTDVGSMSNFVAADGVIIFNGCPADTRYIINGDQLDLLYDCIGLCFQRYSRR